MMVSIDFPDCRTRQEKIQKVFKEEITGLTNTLENCQEQILKFLGNKAERDLSNAPFNLPEKNP